MTRLMISATAVAFLAGAMPVMAQGAVSAADLFNDNCAICHGAKGEGYAKEVVPNGAVRIKKLAGDSAYWDFATFKKAVIDGTDDHGRPMRVMPAFGKTGLYEPPGQMLTDDELKAIQTYMQTFGPKE